MQGALSEVLNVCRQLKMMVYVDDIKIHVRRKKQRGTRG